MPRCRSLAEIFAYVIEREVKLCALYRFALQEAVGEARALLEKLAQRGEAYLEKLEEGRKSGAFTNRPCSFADKALFATLEGSPPAPGRRVPEILIFAIKARHGNSVRYAVAARSESGEMKKLWLSLAEEERRDRLELESYYEREVLGKI